ncbi:hypothetical protein N7532_007075 [Penicillium argentinense]|uniref:alpha-L-fucosidase n=1 Tax=Penicillium argentinense TaxID=1131581 RepID=A0A9W9FH83_9EURO|nr:uncharacterized protein N7532_007075 [Penicillium argentinense]KAJ5100074.1 hypothetical protein N7532_007075 [Penicillium argentinense]
MGAASGSDRDAAAIGGLVSLWFGGLAIGALIVGTIADSIGRLKTIQLGYLWRILGAALSASATSMPWFAFARVISGIGCGHLNTIVPVWTSELADPHLRGAFVAVQFTLAMVGSTTAYWMEFWCLKTQSLSFTWSFPLGFQIVFLLLILAAALLATLREPVGSTQRGFSLASRSKGAALATFAFSIVGGTINMIIPYLIDAIGFWVFILFALISLALLAPIYLFYVETANRHLQQLDSLTSFTMINLQRVGALLTAAAFCRAVIFKPQNEFQALSNDNTSVALDLRPWFNNRAFGLKPNESSFDGQGNSYPAEEIPPERFVYGGTNYRFAAYNESGHDNLLVKGQEIPVPRSKYFSYQMLAASESGMASGSVTAKYADGSSTTGPLLVPAWWSWPYPAGGDLVFSSFLTENTTNYNRSNIFQTINWLDSSKELVSLKFPKSASGSSTEPGGAAVDTNLHVFSLSLLPVPKHTSATARLVIQYARSTQKWIDGTDKVQIVEVVINNVGSSFISRNDTVRVQVESPGLETVIDGAIKRLGPGDQAIVEVGVKNRKGVRPGRTGPATVVIKGEHVASRSYSFKATYGISAYKATYESVYSHEAPNWYNNAKYGIFIHWGIYSVPGWGNKGSKENYAEWYWWWLGQGPSDPTEVYEYQKKTYGTELVYDDFIQNFTADAWSPKEWVDLFADAGANYFVQVSKHHEGYALFDLPENVTKRTSVAMTPHRNLVQELFDAAKKHQPHLHRAVYYSLPEWFHPDYKKYGFSSWPGGNASNPFTNETLPYIGYVPLNDYIEDKILPEMNTLADMGTEIMWCDIGGPNRTVEFASEWFNRAAKEDRQVVMNARCGLPGDFDTPEYARYNGVQVRKWESSLGMDPYSYGYNRATPLASYMNASSIVTGLIDIVSKNGNFLLDVGPTANGTIVDVEQKNLREAGSWIKDHAEAIFNTTYWFVTPEEGDNVRFTISKDAFYIHTLTQPNSTLTLHSPIPWIRGDEVTVVGGKMNGAAVPTKKFHNGSISLFLSPEMVAADRFAWVFKITY